MQIIRLYFFIAILLLVEGTLNAQKIGYIDYELFISTLPEVKAVQTSIETLQAEYQSRGEKMVIAYQEKLVIVQKLEQACYPPKDLMEEAKKLQLEEQKIVAFEKEMQETLAKKTNELMQPIHERVQQAIYRVAKEQGYLFILNSQDSISNSQFLSYKKEEDDITSLLKTKL